MFYKSNAYKVNKLLLINSPHRIHENPEKFAFRFLIQVLEVSVYRVILASFVQLQFSQGYFGYTDDFL